MKNGLCEYCKGNCELCKVKAKTNNGIKIIKYTGYVRNSKKIAGYEKKEEVTAVKLKPLMDLNI